MPWKRFTIFFLGFITRRRQKGQPGIPSTHPPQRRASCVRRVRRSVSAKRGSWMPASRRHPTWRQGGQFTAVPPVSSVPVWLPQLFAWLRRHQIQPFASFFASSACRSAFKGSTDSNSSLKESTVSCPRTPQSIILNIVVHHINFREYTHCSVLF